jgi:hypothetical protein
VNAYSIDHTLGSTNSVVSNQWATRPADQRFLSLGALHEQVSAWADASSAQEIAPRDMHAFVTGGDLRLEFGFGHVNPTNLAFGQVAALAGAPSTYLRKLPAQLAAENLNHGFKNADRELRKSMYLMETDAADDTLRSITSPKYGRIYDRDVVAEVMKLAGQGTGDTRWKVPGTIDWAGKHGVRYNPQVNITNDNTTLYASDRDMFLFLVDDMNPIEVGKLANGDPDLMFRGFYTWNSEVGDKTFGIATMYLRGVCQNRNLWGVEGFNQTTFRHSSGAPKRFMVDAAPALQSYAEEGVTKLVEGVKAAKDAVVTPGSSKDDDNQRREWLRVLLGSKTKADAVIRTAIAEEGKPPESIWDHAQAITAHARSTTFQDERINMEVIAGKLLNKVVA